MDGPQPATHQGGDGGQLGRGRPGFAGLEVSLARFAQDRFGECVFLDRHRLAAIRFEQACALAGRQVRGGVVDSAAVELEGFAVRRQSRRRAGP